LLDQQASAGIFTYEAAADTYELRPEAALALSNTNSPVFLSGGLDIFRSMFDDLDAVVATYRGERTLGWGDHSSCMYSGVREFFRPIYQHNLTQSWLPALPGMVERLETGATVADVGCSEGVSTLVMAQTYPESRFVGADFHEESIAVAASEAQRQGLANAEFVVSDAANLNGKFDLLCFFDCLHDMGDPVGVLAAAKDKLADDGVIVLIEPFAFDTRAENHAALGALSYGASAFLCTPCSLAQPVGRGMGGQAGEPGMRVVFEEAGYGHFTRVAESPFNIVYQARP